MANEVNSNIVLQVLVPEPDDKGFSKVLSRLESIEAVLDRISKTGYKINLTAEIKTEEIQKFLNQANNANKAAAQALNQNVAAAQSQLNKLASSLKDIQTEFKTIEQNGRLSSTKSTFENISENKKTVVTETAKGDITIETNEIIDKNKQLVQTQKAIEKEAELQQRVNDLIAAGGVELQKKTKLSNQQFAGTERLIKTSNGEITKLTSSPNALKEEQLQQDEKLLALEQLRKGEIKDDIKLQQAIIDSKAAELKFEQEILALKKKGFEVATATRGKNAQGVFSGSATLTAPGQKTVLTAGARGLESKDVDVNESLKNRQALDSLRQGTDNKNILKDPRGAFLSAGSQFSASVRSLANRPDNQIALPTTVKLTKIGEEIDAASGKLVPIMQDVFEKKVVEIGDGFIKTITLNSLTGGVKSESTVAASAKQIENFARKQLGNTAAQLTPGNQSFLQSKIPAGSQKSISSRQEFDDASQKALDEGFSRTVSTSKTVNGQLKQTSDFVKVVNGGLKGYTVQQRTVSEVTGEVTEKTLQGAAAYRLVGDTLQRATQKVALWSTATALVFGAVKAIQQAVEATSELEQNTVLLARVGASLGSNFEERKQEAESLTNEIIELTTAIGGSATEAQRAAAVFLRAGQTRIETLQSTRAALLASKIAEVEVVEAAELLSSAQLQFNISAKDTLSVLDQLNSLSNQYRVTTDALLQSISRTGAVYAEQNGTLTQLAATTAVLSQTTARSGAEIGNALKTITTRLTGGDVQSKLFEKLGISINTSKGELKDLNQLLLEVQFALTKLSQAEQTEIVTTIAGTRQKNILIAALNNSVDILIAEAAAISDVGSAQEESSQRAETFKSAIERLQAVLIQIANNYGPAFINVLTTAANALGLVLKILNYLGPTFPKLIAYIVSAVTVFKVLNYTVKTLGITSVITAANEQLLALALGKTTQAASLQAFQLFFASTAQKAYTSSAIASAAATAAFNPILLASVAVIGLSVLALGSYADAATQSAIAQDNSAASLKNHTTELLNQVKAQYLVTQAIESEIALLKERQKLEDSGNENDQTRAESLRKEQDTGLKDLRKKLKDSDINIPVANILENVEGKTTDEQIAALKAASDKAKSDVRQVVADSQTKLNAARENSISDKASIGSSVSLQPGLFDNPFSSTEFKRTQAQNEFISSFGSFGPNLTLTGKQLDNLIKKEKELEQNFKAEDFLDLAGGDKKLAQSIVNAITAAKDLNKELLDTESEINRLKEAAEKLGQPFDEAFARAAIRSKELVKQIERIKADSSITSKVNNAIGFSDEDQQKQKLQETLAIQKELNDNLEEIRKKDPGSQVLAETEEALIKVNDEVKTIEANLNAISLQRFKDEIKSSIKFTDALFNSAGKSELKIRRGLSNASPFTAQLDDIQRREEDLKTKQRDRSIFAQSALNTINNPESTAEERQKAQAEFNANQEAQDETNIQLQDLLLEKYAAERDLVADITLEKKKQTDETARELGLLSTQDKLRTLLLSQQVKARGGKKFTSDELFFTNNDTVSLLQKNFKDSLPENVIENDPSNPLTSAILSARGTPKEIAEAEKRLGPINRGSAEADAIKVAQERDRLENARRQRNGLPPLDRSADLDTAVGGERFRVPQINAPITVGLGDQFLAATEQIASKFEQIAVTQLNAATQDIYARLDSIDNQIKTREPRKPRIANPTN